MKRSVLLRLVVVLLSACLFAPAPHAAHSEVLGEYPSPEHTVVLIESSKSYSDVISPGKPYGQIDAPYINWLARHGASFVNAHALRHPAQPNYLALYAGSAFTLPDGKDADQCPDLYTGGNLGDEFMIKYKDSGDGFAGYAEDMPQAGSTACEYKKRYVRQHCPWTDFPDTRGADVSLPFTDFPTSAAPFSPSSAALIGDLPAAVSTYLSQHQDVAARFAKLPKLSFVIPNTEDDMQGSSKGRSVRAGDEWMAKYVLPYAVWAQKHNSMLIVVWDQDSGSDKNIKQTGNRVPLVFFGYRVKAGAQATQDVNLFDLLRTIEKLHDIETRIPSPFAYPLRLNPDYHLGNILSFASPIEGIWDTPTTQD